MSYALENARSGLSLNFFYSTAISTQQNPGEQNEFLLTNGGCMQ
jgi:hypothetical protein